MARQPEEREDLLREATAMVERAEFSVRAVPGRESTRLDQDASRVVGFRRDGSGSIFLGSDPVYQFNQEGHLRRAHCEGVLIKAEHGRLVQLTRDRTSVAVNLMRHTMSDREQTTFLAELTSRLQALCRQVARGEYDLIGQVPADVDVMDRIGTWLADLELPPKIASTPRVGRIVRDAPRPSPPRRQR